MKKGRKRLPDHLRKTEQVGVALTVSEYEGLVELAASLGVTISALARQSVISVLTERGESHV
jgi:hypothetical protein